MAWFKKKVTSICFGGLVVGWLMLPLGPWIGLVLSAAAIFLARPRRIGLGKEADGGDSVALADSVGKAMILTGGASYAACALVGLNVVDVHEQEAVTNYVFWSIIGGSIVILGGKLFTMLAAGMQKGESTQ